MTTPFVERAMELADMHGAYRWQTGVQEQARHKAMAAAADKLASKSRAELAAHLESASHTAVQEGATEREREQARLGQESADFGEWWDANQVDPLHTMIVRNAAGAAWQERARRAAPLAHPVPAISVQTARMALEAMTEVIGWVPGGHWHTDGPKNSVAKVRAAIQAIRKEIDPGTSIAQELEKK